MASLKLEHIYKVYSNGHKAVSDFNMEIEDGEFIVFVGPSGCGKSTTLRMIAGLEDITSGELYIGDDLVNDMQPKDRDIAMVFQNYALYPHMTVYENMAFGLTLRKMPRSEIHEKVMWAADALGLREYLDRKPKAMSGGQRQRVSLGRAILRNPKVMLLDEPLSNLDAKLRSQMRSVISKLHQQLKTTFIYVTHDQVEAMTLGTRVVVMKLGRVQQIDTPQRLYDHPVNKFVAGFIGTPQMNFFNVTLKEEKDCVTANWEDCEQKPLKLPKDLLIKAEKKFLQGDKSICLGFRCQHVSVENIKDDDNVVNVVVSHFEELGNETLIYGDLKEIEGLGGASKTPIIIKASGKLGFKPGDIIKAKIDVTKVHLFDNESEYTIIPAIPDHNVLPCSIVNEKMTLFGTIAKPDSIAVDFLKNGSISIPLTAIKVGEGKDKAKVTLVETHGKQTIALVESDGKKMFVFVDEKTKVGDTITFSLDFSRASFYDESEALVCAPLADRDNLMATFVNLKTALETTDNAAFEEIKTKRIQEVTDKYAQIEKDFAIEKDIALKEASDKQASLSGGVGAKQAAMQEENARLAKELKEAKAVYKIDLKEAKAKHKEIYQTEVAKIEKQYKEMWENEKTDFKECMMKNKDSESRRARRNSYSIFKESFPQMKQNDLERKTNSLEFEKETEINALQARFTQLKGVTRDTIKENKRKFKEDNYPLDVKTKEYEEKAKALEKKKKEELLRAGLVFFFKYDTYYQMIPDDITNKIIQGMGEKVFTKMFRVEVPHNSFVEAEHALPFKVVSFINYGDKKMYKCSGDMFGKKVTVYIDKTKEIEIGTTLYLAPKLDQTQIYEDERNIRLF